MRSKLLIKTSIWTSIIFFTFGVSVKLLSFLLGLLALLTIVFVMLAIQDFILSLIDEEVLALSQSEKKEDLEKGWKAWREDPQVDFISAHIYTILLFQIGSWVYLASAAEVFAPWFLFMAFASFFSMRAIFTFLNSNIYAR